MATLIRPNVVPVMTFYEEGDWLRIEVPGRPTRLIEKRIAVQILRDFGTQSVSEKSEIYVR